MGRRESVRRTVQHFVAASRYQLVRLFAGDGDRDNAILIAMHDKRRHIETFQVASKVGGSERDDALLRAER